MTTGILVKNTSGHILISSDVEGMHCAGKASYILQLNTGLTNFPNYSKDDTQTTLSGRCIMRYRWYGASTDTPIFFIKPTDYARFHGVLNQWHNNGAWFADIIQSGGTVSAPTVYVFVRPANLTASGNVGIKTQLSNGTTAFDSRLNPLAIKYAIGAQPKTIPCDGGQPTIQSGYAWNEDNLDWDFTSDDTYNRYSSSLLNSSSLMFAAPSLAQAVYSRTKKGYKSSCGYLTGCQDHYSTATWWAMYQQGYRLNYGSLDAGWCVFAAGYYFWSYAEDGGWFGGSGGTAVEGNAPYNDKTINLESNAVIVADSAFYN